MQQGLIKTKTDRSAMRQLALTIALVFAVFCFGPAAIAQQSIAPAGVSRTGRIKRSARCRRCPRIHPSTNSPAKAVTVGLRELSPWSMFVSASLIVQAIMTGLVFASLITWTIFVAKLVELFIARRRLRRQ